MATTAVVGGIVAGGWAAYNLARLAFADADLALLSKGPVPKGALQDKVVWITGSSQGIGEALAKEFANHGARLILSARREVELNRIKQELTQAHDSSWASRVLVLPLNVTEGPDAMSAAAEKAEAAFDGAGVDYLVHNAAAVRPKCHAEDTTPEQAQSMFDVNFFGAVNLTKAVLPSMLRRKKGRIVVMSSAAGVVPAATQAMYAATKAAMNAYFSSLHFEVCDKGIGVTIVCPGPIASDASNEFHQKENRVTVKRCAELVVRASAHGVDEAWISHHPVLLFMYATQLIPRLANFLQRRIGPKRVRALEEGGKDMYSFNLLAKGKAGKERRD